MAGLAATGLSALAAAYFIIPPLHTLQLPPGADAIGLIIFVFVGAVLSWLNETLRRAKKRAEDAETAERRHRLQWEQTLASIGDGVIATDILGRVEFSNATAQDLTGWTAANAKGNPLQKVFFIIRETTQASSRNPVEGILMEGASVVLTDYWANDQIMSTSS